MKMENDIQFRMTVKNDIKKQECNVVIMSKDTGKSLRSLVGLIQTKKSLKSIELLLFWVTI